MGLDHHQFIMSDKKKDYGGYVPSGFLLPQSILLAIHYGFEKPMPWWVTWFPCLATISILVGVLLVAGIIMLIAAITEK